MRSKEQYAAIAKAARTLQVWSDCADAGELVCKVNAILVEDGDPISTEQVLAQLCLIVLDEMDALLGAVGGGVNGASTEQEA